MQSWWNLLGALIFLVGFGHADAAMPDTFSESYGLTQGNPIEECRPEIGQRYFSRLACPSGERPTISRIGSTGPRTPIPADITEEETVEMVRGMLEMRRLEPGEPDYHIVDAYEVVCGTRATTIYVDMYHCAPDQPASAPAGFRFAP